MGIALNFLCGIGTFFYGFYLVAKFLIRDGIPSIVALPSKMRCLDESKHDSSIIWVISLFILLISPLFFGSIYSQNQHLWALYCLYAVAGLDVTNLLSGIYELGRWQRNKKNAEKQEAKVKIQGQVKEAPICIDDFSSLNTEVSGLPPGVSRSKADAMVAKLGRAHSNGYLSEGQLSSLTRMVYSRL